LGVNLKDSALRQQGRHWDSRDSKAVIDSELWRPQAVVT